MTRLQEIRAAEKASHEEIYTTAELFQPGSWLAKPVAAVMDLLPRLEGRENLRVLDLGCGVGRNSIPIAKRLRCPVDCVDILPMAVEKLEENGEIHGAAQYIRGVVSAIDDYAIAKASYDLIVAISALEHVGSEQCFAEKLMQIQEGVKPGGFVCLVVNANVTEADRETGEPLPPQFEVNLPTEEMTDLVSRYFSGWQIDKKTVVHQCYAIPRGERLAELNTDVVTFVARKTGERTNVH